MLMTLAEKVLAKNAGLEYVRPEQIVEAVIDTVMLHDIGTPGIIPPLAQLGYDKISENIKCVIIPDHFVPAPTVQAAENLRITKQFAEKMGCIYYGVGRGGVSHQVMLENGHVLPGQIVVAPDSHATSYGALGALGTGFGVTDVAIALGTGRLWFTVPPTIKLILNGRLRDNVGAMDVIIHMLQVFGETKLIYKSLEITGEIIGSMSVSERICIANLAYELGVKFCLIIPDKATSNYLASIGAPKTQFILPDDGAQYEEIIEMDLSDLEPMVAFPHHPTCGRPAIEAVGTKIDQAFIGSCANGRIEDLRIAACVLKGKKVHSMVRMIVSPASQAIYQTALDEGLIDTFIKAGACVTNPGCGACLGGHMGLIADEEICISTSNRNYRGRMGSTKGEVYLASPTTVATSAVTGVITLPNAYRRELR